MKKLLPLIILFVGLAVVAGAYFFISRGGDEPEIVDNEEEEVALLDVPLEERPVIRLTPRGDGHWLDMKVDKMMIEQAETMDYELLYDLPDGRQQGVPGMVELSGRDSVEAELLLGSESSGKFRYDEGVETGTMTLEFRNEDGRLLSRFISEFHLQTGTDSLSSVDGEFEYALEEESDEYFVVMNTVGYPADVPGTISTEIYGVFSSDEETQHPGVVSINGVNNYYRWASDDDELETLNTSGEMEDIGIFAGLSEVSED